ncbi:hypothetical protein [Blastococcus sp. TBT05-19]|uniref:hypothetical protein n=1 Tax=Blastococcus sp. TBT05-19 TaxID=2250581 RepID=UPI0011BEA95D|nr:hypothetical protein [Blastococcus sp. TBT05-19]
MYVADHRSPAGSTAPAAQRVPAATRSSVAPQWTAPPRRRPSGTAGKVLAVVFAVAWLTCPMVEPMPVGDVHYPLWQLPIDLATLATIVGAVATLWRGSPRAPHHGIAAGVMMAVMTMVCPLAGHGPTGWWTWVQAAMSLFVILTSVALVRIWPTLRRPVS